MRSNKTTIVLALLLCGGLGVLVARWYNSKPVGIVTAPPKKESVFASRNSNSERPIARSAKTLRLDPKENVELEMDDKDLVQDLSPKQAIEKKFNTVREDGRKAVLDLFGGDADKMHKAINNAMQNEDFRKTYEQRRALEAQWQTASDQQKEVLVKQIQDLRAQTFQMLRDGSPNTQNGTVIITGGTTTFTQGNQNNNGATPAPAAPPVVIM
jgi:hypothetical protein